MTVMMLLAYLLTHSASSFSLPNQALPAKGDEAFVSQTTSLPWTELRWTIEPEGGTSTPWLPVWLQLRVSNDSSEGRHFDGRTLYQPCNGYTLLVTGERPSGVEFVSLCMTAYTSHIPSHNVEIPPGESVAFSLRLGGRVEKPGGPYIPFLDQPGTARIRLSWNKEDQELWSGSPIEVTVEEPSGAAKNHLQMLRALDGTLIPYFFQPGGLGYNRGPKSALRGLADVYEHSSYRDVACLNVGGWFTSSAEGAAVFGDDERSQEDIISAREYLGRIQGTGPVGRRRAAVEARLNEFVARRSSIPK